MYDLLGREVKAVDSKQSAIHKNEIEIKIEKGNLKAGIYFYKVMSEQGVIGVGKLVIQ